MTYGKMDGEKAVRTTDWWLKNYYSWDIRRVRWKGKIDVRRWSHNPNLTIKILEVMQSLAITKYNMRPGESSWRGGEEITRDKEVKESWGPVWTVIIYIDAETPNDDDRIEGKKGEARHHILQWIRGNNSGFHRWNLKERVPGLMTQALMEPEQWFRQK